MRCQLVTRCQDRRGVAISDLAPGVAARDWEGLSVVAGDFAPTFRHEEYRGQYGIGCHCVLHIDTAHNIPDYRGALVPHMPRTH
jgi:hypothetical protein